MTITQHYKLTLLSFGVAFAVYLGFGDSQVTRAATVGMFAMITWLIVRVMCRENAK